MVDVLVSLWDGKKGTFTKVTKMSGNDVIENPWINIIACTTPSWIAGNFPQYMIGGGFTSRCVFVYTDTKRQEVAYPDEMVPPEFIDMQNKLVHDLEIISTLIGEANLLPEAREWGTEWYQHHWRNPPKHLDKDKFGGYLARKQTHMHKLAMVLSAAQRDDLTITADDLRISCEMLTALESDMPYVFRKIGQDEITGGTSDIIDIVLKKPGISRTDVYRLLHTTLSYNDFEFALRGALATKHIEMIQMGNDFILQGIKNV